MGNGTVHQNTNMITGLPVVSLPIPTPETHRDIQSPMSSDTITTRNNTSEAILSRVKRLCQVIERPILYVLVVCLLVHIFYTKHEVMASPSR